jgi:tRNA (guanine37-N1)-methyltransferase
MNIFFLTLFPTQVGNFFLKGIFQKAHEKSLFNLKFINIRDFATDNYKKVDDHPFGAQEGMLLKPDILTSAIKSIDNFERYRIIYPCPKGKIFKQSIAAEYVKEDGLIFICGYYEGIDERLFQVFNIERISIGDFILSSSESPSLMITEAVLRLIPEVIGKQESVQNDSIVNGLLEYPHYTHPREFMGCNVPEILVSGHHKNIADWRKKQSLTATLIHRPDLLADYKISKNEKTILTDILKEENK